MHSFVVLLITLASLIGNNNYLNMVNEDVLIRDLRVTSVDSWTYLEDLKTKERFISEANFPLGQSTHLGYPWRTDCYPPSKGSTVRFEFKSKEKDVNNLKIDFNPETDIFFLSYYDQKYDYDTNDFEKLILFYNTKIPAACDYSGPKYDLLKPRTIISNISKKNTQINSPSGDYNEYYFDVKLDYRTVALTSEDVNELLSGDELSSENADFIVKKGLKDWRGLVAIRFNVININDESIEKEDTPIEVSIQGRQPLYVPSDTKVIFDLDGTFGEIYAPCSY